MSGFGQDRYVMMRPQEHELPLPARLFHWRGHEGDPEVVTFRIARNYEIAELALEHVLASLKDLPAGVRHTLCFEIGRASCRARVCHYLWISVLSVSLKKKIKSKI